MQSPEAIVARALGMPRLSNAANQTLELREVVPFEDPLFRSNPESYFRLTAKAARLGTETCPRELQPMTTERNLCRR